jgi:predicted RNase H-like nuclease
VERIAGIDGCKGGWLVVSQPEAGTSCTEVEFAANLGDVFDRRGIGFAVIDMPIGLVDGPESRNVEPALRRFLPGKASSVFNTPCRAALSGGDYGTASALNRAALGLGLSRQAFGILAKIAEIDGLVARLGQARLREGHPEVSFAVMNGGPVLAPKRRTQGKLQRQALLEAEGFDLAPLIGRAKELPGKLDDLLDAIALLWTARRHLRGQSIRFPDAAIRDRTNLEMSVIA